MAVRRRGVRAGTVLAALALVAAACGAGEEIAFETRTATGTAGAGAYDDPDPSEELAAGGLLPPAGRPGQDGDTGAGAPVGGGRPGAAAGDGRGAPAAGRPGGVVRIGSVLPLVGGQREFGEPILRVTQAFVDEVNARGGIGGARLELVAYNACLTCQDEALQAVRRLVEQDGVFAVVNTYVMVIAFMPVISYLDERRVPLIQGGAHNMTTDALSPVTFVTAVPGAFYGRFVPEVVVRYMGVDRIGLTYLNVPAEASGIPRLREELARYGIEVVREEPVRAEEDAVTGMDGAITRMRTAGAQAVVATNPVLLAFGRMSANRQAWQVPWYAPAAWSRLLEDACGRVCDRLVFTDTAGLSYIDRDSPQMAEFHAVMDRRYPQGARTGHELAAWAGMQLLAEVLARTGPDNEAFLAEIESIRGLDLGTTAPLTFSPDRHMGGTATVLLQLRDGRYVRASEPLNFGYIDP